MSDRIEIRSLRVVGTHGVLAHEQAAAQPFEVDLVVEADVEAAAASDAIGDALDYGPLVAVAARVVSEERFALLESLAEAIAAAVLAEERVRGVEVAVRKLRPPLPFDLESVGVRIRRRRPERAGG